MIKLVVVVIALFLIERLFIVRHGRAAWVVLSGSFKPRRLDLQGGWANRFGSLHMLSCLPDGGLLVVAEEWPCTLSSQGIGDGVSRFALWDDLSQIRAEENWVLIDGAKSFKMANRVSAAGMAHVLETVRAAEESERDELIDAAVRARYDFRRAKDEIADVSDRLSVPRHLSSAFTVVWLYLLPLSLLVAKTAIGLLAMVGVGLLLWLAAVVLVWRGLDLPPGERIESILALLLFPPTTVRAPEILSGEEDFGVEPIAMGLALDDPDYDWVAQTLAMAKHPLPNTFPESGEARTTAMSFSALKASHCEEAIREAGYDIEEMSAPERESDDDLSFCPRCHATFAFAEARCKDCRGLPTQPF